MNGDESRPLAYVHVIEEDVRLGQKRLEAIGDTKFLRATSGVFSATRTPAIKKCPLRFQSLNVLNRRRDWNAFGTGAPDKGVVDIDIDIDGRGHVNLVRRDSCRWWRERIAGVHRLPRRAGEGASV